jgi:hypothetical protein
VALLLREGVEASGEALAPPPGDDTAPLAPLRWLLEQAAAEPIPLTQTGVINRALVRRSAEVFTWWWDSDLHGPPHRELEVRGLEALRELLLRRRLLRRRGRTLQLTRRGRRLLGDGDALVTEGLRALFGAEPFEDAIGELQLAYLLAHGGALERTTAMGDAVHAAIVADGWRSGSEPPARTFISGRYDGPLSLAVMLGIVRREYHYDRASFDLVDGAGDRWARPGAAAAGAVASDNGPAAGAVRGPRDDGESAAGGAADRASDPPRDRSRSTTSASMPDAAAWLEERGPCDACVQVTCSTGRLDDLFHGAHARNGAPRLP